MFFDLSDLYRLHRLRVEGESNDRGFRIRVQHRRLDTLNAGLKFSGFYDDDARTTSILRWGSRSGTFLWVMFWILMYPRWYVSLADVYFVLCGTYSTSMLGEFIASRLKLKTTWQWHACEHKALRLLRLGAEPTKENLQRITAVSPFCGSVRLFTLATLYLSVATLFLYPVPAALIASSCLASLWLVLMLRDAAGPRPWYTNAMRVIGLPMLWLALLFEKLFALKTPTNEQLEATLRFLRTAYRRHPWLASPKLRRSPVYRAFIKRTPKSTPEP